MNRFDELCVAFTAWHEQAVFVQHAWQRFPIVLANRLREYLGAPETFDDPVLQTDRRSHRYVSAATATWNSHTESFDLKIMENPSEFFDIEAYQKDGRFYFSVAVYLERGRRIFPKQPFWFLFSLGWENQENFSLLVRRTSEIFVIPYKDSGEVLEPVCESLRNLLMEDLSISPFAVQTKSKSLPPPS